MMAFPTTKQDSASPDVAQLRTTANLQLGSTFFGRLPSEIREMIYAECWLVSGLQQHVFLSRHDRQLTHSPCILMPGQTDERNDEIQRLMCCQGQNRRGSRSRSSFVVDEQWASRFSSPWHEHWRCEEEMLHPEKTARNDELNLHHRTLFLPILLACKQTYIEAFPSLYASVTLVFTDLESAHRCLLSPPLQPPTTLFRSLVFSLALTYDTLHEQRFHTSPSLCNGPWARLCTTLSDMARFASLRSVTIRLDLVGDDDGGVGDWRRVRERWALCAIRGILARHLTVQLPAVAHPRWSRPYQYLDGDKTSFQIERYPKMRWVSVGDGRLVEPLVDPLPRSPVEGRLEGPGESKLQKATRSIKGFVVGMMSD
ncbi:hypothetical protein HD806DRAFT_260264 [Xylariaceae sp. AK1471]|nr:hypothetical protein HD806DRAFT_260264 [Xylariaceae sp. AK1471]